MWVVIILIPDHCLSTHFTKFMISISLPEKLCCQNFITSIKVINMTGPQTNKLRTLYNHEKSFKWIGYLKGIFSEICRNDL